MSTLLLFVIALVSACVGAPVAFAQQAAVRAETGSIAIGGSVRDTTINIGISSDQLDALVRDRTRLLESWSASLQRELDLNLGQVQAALRILGEASVPAEQLTAKLVEVAERFRELQAAAAAQPGDDPKVSALKADAQKAIDAGDLERADEILAAVEAIQTEAAERLALNAAETSAAAGSGFTNPFAVLGGCQTLCPGGFPRAARARGQASNLLGLRSRRSVFARV